MNIVDYCKKCEHKPFCDYEQKINDYKTKDIVCKHYLNKFRNPNAEKESLK